MGFPQIWAGSWVISQMNCPSIRLPGAAFIGILNLITGYQVGSRMVKRGQKGIISQKDRKVLLAPWEFKLHKVKYTKMAVVAVTSKNKRNASKYIKALGGNIGSRLVLPRDAGRPLEESLEGVGGLLLTDGPDIDPGEYGESPDPVAGLQVSRALDTMEMGLLRRALEAGYAGAGHLPGDAASQRGLRGQAGPGHPGSQGGFRGRDVGRR